MLDTLPAFSADELFDQGSRRLEQISKSDGNWVENFSNDFSESHYVGGGRNTN